MNKELIKANEKRLIYRRNPETKVSFYRQSGSSDLLPLRINFSTDYETFSRLNQTGRAALFKKVGECKARFTRNDTRSPYRIYNGGNEERISFSLWGCQEYPLILGFADVGRTNERGRMQPTPDLVVVVRTIDNCRDTLDMRIYPGMYHNREVVLKVLNDELRKSNPFIV